VIHEGMSIDLIQGTKMADFKSYLLRVTDWLLYSRGVICT